MHFGAHVSAAGGITNAIGRATELGCDVFQIFVSAPQTFRSLDRTDKEIDLFTKMYRSAGFRGLFFHAIYLINLASKNERLVNLSKESLIHYLTIGDQLGAMGTIVHLGSYGYKVNVDEGLTLSEEKVLDQVAFHIADILSKTPSSQLLIVENAAGKSKIGGSMDDLTYLHKKVASDRLAFCLDTQHLFAAGVDTSDFNVFGDYLSRFDSKIGIDNLACLHANDSKTALGSEHDRHENIGEGIIGTRGFANILRQPFLKDKPFILEVPGFDGKGPDVKNMQILRAL